MSPVVSGEQNKVVVKGNRKKSKQKIQAGTLMYFMYGTVGYMTTAAVQTACGHISSTTLKSQ